VARVVVAGLVGTGGGTYGGLVGGEGGGGGT